MGDDGFGGSGAGGGDDGFGGGDGGGKSKYSNSMFNFYFFK